MAPPLPVLSAKYACQSQHSTVVGDLIKKAQSTDENTARVLRSTWFGKRKKSMRAPKSGMALETRKSKSAGRACERAREADSDVCMETRDTTVLKSRLRNMFCAQKKKDPFREGKVH